MPWIDQYSGNQYRITTRGEHGTQTAARLKTYGEVVREYEFHAESKCADESGKTSDKQTNGLLQRRHIRIDYTKYIGKESNSLEEVKAGLVDDEENAYTEYNDPRRGEWAMKILPALRNARLSTLEKVTGIPRSTKDLRAERSEKPHEETYRAIVKGLQDMGMI